MNKMFSENQETLFINELSEGINLFLGAGFSCLPNNRGEKLPDSNILCKEICEKFDINNIFLDDLYSASEMVPQTEYQSFLRNRFTVGDDINNDYYLLDKLNIKSIITTNIDNIIPTIYASSESTHNLVDKASYGTIRKNESNIDYVTLNGNVCSEESHLYFGKFELSLVDQKNKDMYEVAQSLLRDNSVLFWGYSFSDNGVLKIVKKLLDTNKHANIWIQCLPSDRKQITFFEALGCKTIIADTSQMFVWIKEFLKSTKTETKEYKGIKSKILNVFRVPKQFAIETNEIIDYYKSGNTHWYSIYNNHAFETKLVDNIWAWHLNNKNVLILGPEFSGKTTALMQCAVKRNNDATFYFYGTNTKEEATFFLNTIGDNKVIVYLQDCAKDIELFCTFASAPNVELIATADKYSFENVKHIVAKKGIQCYEKYVGDIDEITAKQVYNHIPRSIAQGTFSYKPKDDEEYSFLELLGSNVKGFISYKSVLKILQKICIFDDNRSPCNEIQLIALTVYLEARDSLMSTDLFFSYFGFTDYFNQIIPLSNRVKGLLKDTITVESDQDYFSIRSDFFLKYAEQAFLKDSILREVYRTVISKFIHKVSKGNVFRYDIFKRRAYDSRLFYTLFKDENDESDFSEDAIKLYDILYDYDESPYTLQQKALFLSLFRRSKEAFSIIDTALSFYPNNFSMKNSKAEIIFNANKTFRTYQAKEQLCKAIDILEECKKNDKRQNYHAILYAKIVIHLHENFDDKDDTLIDTAIEWLNSIESDRTINKLIKDLKQLH
ncbi:MAG: SIR2 family protein [Oscillospiraceae bacterium]|nr:SIR2 family protein [Oscillospiraceae bacterium]